MLRQYRRFWIVLAGLLLLTPMALEIVAPSSETMLSDELRVTAPPPDMPRTLDAWLALPPVLDAYLGDHFGLRLAMIRAHAVIAHLWLRSGNDMVMVGLGGSLFYRGDNAAVQSAGLLVRPAQIDETVAVLAAMHTALAARGIRFLVAVPPNAATIYPDRLPRWARDQGRPTEYDLMLKALAARGIKAVDLRPALREARRAGGVYLRHNSHWNSRGALAAFDAIVAADGHPGWRLDPAAVLSPPVTIVGGDLARMLGVEHDVTEPVELLTSPGGNVEKFSPEPFPTFLATADRSDNETIMVIGDSFTGGVFPDMVLAHAGRVAWTHHQFCAFDWTWIDQFHPNEVWWMPTERYIVCTPGLHPKNMPVGGAAQR
jgi:hypothetical protein